MTRWRNPTPWKPTGCKCANAAAHPEKSNLPPSAGGKNMKKQSNPLAGLLFCLLPAFLGEGVLGLVPGEPLGEGGAFLKLAGFEGV